MSKAASVDIPVVLSERTIIEAMLLGYMDEQKSFLDPAELEAIQTFETEFWYNLQDTHDTFVAALADSRMRSSSQRDFALNVCAFVKPMYYKYFYAMYNSKPLMQFMKDEILKNLSSADKLNSVRWLFGEAKYEGPVYYIH